MPKSVILTGGGTAGHVVPNLALLPYLYKYFDEVHYIGTENGIERKLTEGKVIYHAIPAAKLKRSFSLKNLLTPFILLKGIFAAKKLIKQIKPEVIFSKGGYVALPVVLAAKRVPVISHESDMSLGLANKVAKKRTRYICTSFKETAESLKNGIHTGAPLRQEIYFGDKFKALRECGFISDGLPHKPIVLIMGGSLGATAINDCVYKGLDELTKDYYVIHIVGDKNLNGLNHSSYKQIGYTPKIENFFAAADICVTRGGANTAFELMALKKPSIIIPMPKGASRGDQIQNAEYFQKKGCVNVLYQEELTPQKLISEIKRVNAEELKANMSRMDGKIDGTQAIAQLIYNVATEQIKQRLPNKSQK